MCGIYASYMKPVPKSAAAAKRGYILRIPRTRLHPRVHGYLLHDAYMHAVQENNTELHVTIRCCFVRFNEAKGRAQYSETADPQLHMRNGLLYSYFFNKPKGNIRINIYLTSTN